MTRHRRRVLVGRRTPRTSQRSGPAGGLPVAKQDGFVTIAMVGLMGLLLAVTMAVAAVGAVAVARHRAAGAADLAALAAAAHTLEGPATACAAAAAVTRAHGARLASCALAGADALVEVVIRPRGPLGRWGEATAVARAGPAAQTITAPRLRSDRSAHAGTSSARAASDPAERLLSRAAGTPTCDLPGKPSQTARERGVLA